ncbi:MAG: EAL domain-containing protein, partial [Gammaproteobacteria bacterium]
MTTISNLLVNMRRGFAAQPANDDNNGLLHSLPHVVFELDTDGRWRFLSRGWTALSGHGIEESLGAQALEYVHPQDRSACEELFQRAFGGPSPALTMRLLTRNIDSRWVELLAGPGGAHVVGTLTDVTARREREELSRAGHRTLESLMHNLPGMVYRCRNNEHWTMEYVSPGSLELTGYAPEDLIDNRTIAYADLIFPGERQRVWNEVQCALREHTDFDLTYRIRGRREKERWIWERGRGVFSTNGELLGLEGYMTDITRGKRDQDRQRAGALHDPVLHLPSPALFNDRLLQAVQNSGTRESFYFALLLVQIDRFDSLLDKYGRQSAQQLVQETSSRLQDELEPGDTLSRLEGGCFGLLREHTRDIKDVNDTARRVQECVLLPITLDDTEVYVTASIGIALSSSGYASAEDMFTDAGSALSRARALGGARHEVFDLRIHAKAAAQSQMQDEIERAMEAGELSVYWQPVTELASGNMAGLEARIVWHHQRKGLLFAEDFVPAAENTQLIIPLWDWMLSRASEQLRRWQDMAETRRIAAAIQIYGKTLLDAESVLRLGEQLLAAKPQQFDLALGVTENVLSQTPQAVAKMLEHLRVKKIRLVLDGFGSGLSSLSMLRDMPIDS